MYKCFTYFQDVSYLLWREMIDDVQKYNSPTQSSPILANHVSLRWKLAYCQSQSSEIVGNLIDGSEKRNRQLRFQFDSSHDSEKRSKLNSLWKNAPTHTIAGVPELYQQLLPTKVYYNRKTKSQVTDEKCRL